MLLARAVATVCGVPLTSVVLAGSGAGFDAGHPPQDRPLAAEHKSVVNKRVAGIARLIGAAKYLAPVSHNHGADGQRLGQHCGHDLS